MPTELATDSQELFGGDAPEHIRTLIEQARSCPRERSAALLWAAVEADPVCLPPYYLLYKLHAGRREWTEAERAARLGLAAAGSLCGLPQGAALPSTEALSAARFAINGPARFWLFTLKALAFISLRRGQTAQASELIGWIEACDPTHSVGSDVTRALLGAAQQ